MTCHQQSGLVDGLYYFRDHYFESHSVGDAGRKQQDVLKEMEKTLQQMGEIDGSSQGRARALMLKGKALNVTPDYSPQAEELLSKAVKLDPELGSSHDSDPFLPRPLCLSAADVLGNAYLSLFFHTGQSPGIAQQALSAYAQAEKVDPTASCNPDLHLNRATLHKYEENYTEALEGFSRAAALDPAWPEPRQRQQQLLDFLERLTSLLDNKGKVKGKKLQSMLGSLGPSQLGPCGDGRYQGSSGQKVALEHRPLSALQPGVNTGVVVLGRVVFSLTTDEKVPFTFGLADSTGPCFAVTVYNMVQSWGVLIGDRMPGRGAGGTREVTGDSRVIQDHSPLSVLVSTEAVSTIHDGEKGPELSALTCAPRQLRQTRTEPSVPHSPAASSTFVLFPRQKSFSFPGIRVETPLLLVVNGKTQGPGAQAAATVSYRTQSD
nr:tetratricopeptide repeat protein 5 [Pelodiscus sinensis]|eukprot:XP_025037795.1 tetratricopeptide repeat protein 5 [Pelodiscus sinensis]